MKKTKNIIIILLILVILIIIAMLVISLLDRRKEVGNNNTNNNINSSANNNIIDNTISEEDELRGETRIDAPDERVTAKDVTILKNHSTFFSIEKLMSRYFLYLRAGNKDAVYDMVEESYKNENGINTGNVLEILRAGNLYEGNYTLKEVYERKDNYKPIYFISGILEKDGTKTSYYFIMKQDVDNISFSLRPITAEDYRMYLNGRKEENFEEDIELGKYNQIVSVTMKEEEIVKKYFNSYIQNARYNPQEAYNSLSEDYRDARFGSYNEFVEYLEEENKSKQLESFDSKAIKNLEDFETRGDYEEYMINLNHRYIDKYFHYIEDEKDYYVCIDYYGNYYIFETNGVMNYKLYLDTYTIELNYFTSQYEKEKITMEEKGQIVINRIFEALNNKDYKYIYNKLDNVIKSNYESYEKFAEIMQNNLFANNSIELDNYSEDDEGCLYELIITDSEGKDTKELTMSIEIKLQVKNFVITRMILKY